MRIQITARHCQVPIAIRARAEAQIQKMLKYEPRLSAAELVFDTERHLKRVEAVLTVDGRGTLVARAEGAELLDALDRLTDRLRRGLRRQREERRSHQASKPFESPAV